MIISKQAIKKIKKILENGYNNLLMTTAGIDVLDDEEIALLTEAGYEVKDDPSLLELVYYNNVLNDLVDSRGPTTIADMQRQQQNRPQAPTHTAAEEHITENYRHTVEKHKNDMMSRIEGIIRDNNNDFRFDEIQNPNRADIMSQLTRESNVGKLKQTLRDLSGDATRNWERIAVTETANAIGLGSVDRVLDQNEGKESSDIYVYRIPVNDSALCKHCRKFYLDGDGSPAVYRLSTLLGNGTNYGKKTADWNPVVTATHPNDRESGVLELRSGWKVGPEGRLEFIGQDEWLPYISKKLRS